MIRYILPFLLLIAGDLYAYDGVIIPNIEKVGALRFAPINDIPATAHKQDIVAPERRTGYNGINIEDYGGINLAGSKNYNQDLFLQNVYNGRSYMLAKNDYGSRSLYIKYAVRYYSISGDPGFINSAIGGMSAGLADGYDRYRQTGVIDLAVTARSAALMTGSGYLGNYAATTVFQPLISGSLGSVAVGALGDMAGGAAAGALFAAGALATGSADRHSARIMMAKSAVGSVAGASASLILGTAGVTTGVFSAGTLLLPYAVAAGAAYFVDKFFQSIDKIEEKERIDMMITGLNGY